MESHFMYSTFRADLSWRIYLFHGSYFIAKHANAFAMSLTKYLDLSVVRLTLNSDEAFTCVCVYLFAVGAFGYSTFLKILYTFQVVTRGWMFISDFHLYEKLVRDEAIQRVASVVCEMRDLSVYWPWKPSKTFFIRFCIESSLNEIDITSIFKQSLDKGLKRYRRKLARACSCQCCCLWNAFMTVYAFSAA